MAHSHPSMTPHKSWLLFLLGTLLFSFHFMQMNSMNTLGTWVAQRYDMSPSHVGWLSSAYLLAIFSFSPMSGRILERCPLRRIVLGLMAVSTVGAVIMRVATHPAVFAAGRYVVGIAHTLCFLSCTKLAQTLLPHTQRARALGVMMAMGMIGGLLAQAPLSRWVQAHGLERTLSLGILVSGLLWCIVYTHLQVPDEPTSMACPPAPWKQLLARPINWLAGAYVAAVAAPVFVLGSLWGNAYLMHHKHLTLQEASWVSTMIFVGTLFGAPVSGWISDKLQNRQSIMAWGAVLFGMTVAWIQALHQAPLAGWSMLFFVFGFVSGFQTVGFAMITENNPPHLLGRSIAMSSMLVMGASSILQVLFGFLLSWPASSTQPDALHFNTAFLEIWLSVAVAILTSWGLQRRASPRSA